jgi:hypothetical protein
MNIQSIVLLVLAILCVLLAVPLAIYGIAGWPWFLAIAALSIIAGLRAAQSEVVDEELEEE